MELQAIQLSKKFGAKTAVDKLNLTLSCGVYGLLGANGAGKTTLLRLLSNIQEPTSGEILYNGQNIRKLGQGYSSLLGYLPQHFSYYPDFCALDFLLYAAALKGLSTRQAKTKATAMLATVGLTAERRRKIKTFSGGMKQRLGIAQALLNDPSILILDEPTVGLDPQERIRFRKLLSGLGPNHIVILSTHIVSDLELVADKIIIMQKGQVIHLSKPDQSTAANAGDLETLYMSYFQGDEKNADAD